MLKLAETQNPSLDHLRKRKVQTPQEKMRKCVQPYRHFCIKA